MTKMAGNYRSYKLSISHGIENDSIVTEKQEIHSHQHREVDIVKKRAGGNPHKQEEDLCSFITSKDLAVSTTTEATIGVRNCTLKNYFVPLHVDCSVEYELPKQQKSPVGKRFEPLLMIHPCYFRKIESQHRSPFINNMPNCRHRTAMFVGVALVSQELNNTSPYSSISSLKKAGVRAQQHHYNKRQHVISQYGPISNTNKNKFPKVHTRKQQTSQHNLPLLPQQTCYPERNEQLLDNSLAPKQNALDLFNKPNYHPLSHFDSTIQTKTKSNQQDLLKNSSPSKLISDQWDQLTATAIHNPKNVSSASNNNICDRKKCTIVSSLKLGKRDAMISGSGEYLNNSLSISNISIQKELNMTLGKNISLSSNSLKKKKTNNETRKNGLSSPCLAQTTTLPWDSNTNALPSISTRDQSLLTAIPNNFRAGSNVSLPRKPNQHEYKIIIDNNIVGTSTQYDTLPSKSTMTAIGDFKILPSFSAAKSGVAALSAVT
ncbi:centrosomal and chromosomal factor-like isoform X2 [Eupeodes corollae]|uniref:centrosomal and chromosomal factor-like isoform X2 n=1 Tax=Eupeodes corollae TaxID=290404 RepID=UPI00249163F7|nr:centrosomal and chromosomal factor-like isoform X2 [Eupeodes corollae]